MKKHTNHPVDQHDHLLQLALQPTSFGQMGSELAMRSADSSMLGPPTAFPSCMVPCNEDALDQLLAEVLIDEEPEDSGPKLAQPHAKAAGSAQHSRKPGQRRPEPRKVLERDYMQIKRQLQRLADQHELLTLRCQLMHNLIKLTHAFDRLKGRPQPITQHPFEPYGAAPLAGSSTSRSEPGLFAKMHQPGAALSMLLYRAPQWDTPVAALEGTLPWVDAAAASNATAASVAADRASLSQGFAVLLFSLEVNPDAAAPRLLQLYLRHTASLLGYYLYAPV
jgi:hypothetical protein